MEITPISAPVPVSEVTAGVPFAWSGLSVFMWIVIGFFFLALVLYYFTGSKPGAGIFKYFMRVGTRFYLYSWMLLGWVIGVLGLAVIFRLVIFALLPDFGLLVASDLQTGVVLVAFAAIILGIHWFLAEQIENKREKNGTFLTKIFTFIGVTGFSFLFFGSLLSFAMQFIDYVNEGETRPGGTLATVLAALPVWAFFVSRAIWLVKRED